MPNRIISGTVKPPKDLGPAVDALPKEAKQRLLFKTNGRAVTPKDIAQSADWYREKYGHG